MTERPSPRQEPWYLVGLPGTGKTKVGRLLARMFDVPHIDIDALIVSEQGRSINTIFDEDGEAAFRDLERKAILDTAGQPAIVSLGGGAVIEPRTRRYLEEQMVIWLDASDRELVRRVRRRRHRPLLRKNPGWTLARLRRERASLYEQVADMKVRSSSAPVSTAIAQILAESMGWQTINVEANKDYPVYVGAGTTELLAGSVPRTANRAFLVVPESLVEMAAQVITELERAGVEVVVFPHEDGEPAKDLPVAEAAWNAMGDARIGRKDVVVTFGGGVTTDLGGFLAATWLRGVRVIHVPTSLLAMVDASVGSKTGINTASGKNLVGAFHDPLAVIADTEYLATLPEGEFRAGLAEIIKAGFIGVREILNAVADNPQIKHRDWATGSGQEVLDQLIVQSVQLKSDVVSQDRLESGAREHLNYGHTMGHAIEKAENFKLRHGEAVSIGAVFAAQLAEHLGSAPRGSVRQHLTLFAAAGLPVTYEGDLDVLLDYMRADKKVRDGSIRFALLEEDGMIVREVPEAVVIEVARQAGLELKE